MTIYKDTTEIQGVFILDSSAAAAGERFKATKTPGCSYWLVEVQTFSAQKPLYRCAPAALRSISRIIWQNGTAPENRRTAKNMMRIFDEMCRKGYEPGEAEKITKRIFDQFQECPQGLSVNALAARIIPAE